MEEKKLYHTLENRNNAEEILMNGPFLCNDKDSWLGDGYYFWDTFIENAHWWGRNRLKCNNGYIICQAICDFDENNCLDLVGNTKHIEMFSKSYAFLVKKGIASKKTTVKTIIDFLRKNNSEFKFEAIRINGLGSKSINSRFSLTLNFVENRHHHYFDLKPPYQICLFDKRSLNLRNFKIIFPANN